MSFTLLLCMVTACERAQLSKLRSSHRCSVVSLTVFFFSAHPSGRWCSSRLRAQSPGSVASGISSPQGPLVQDSSSASASLVTLALWITEQVFCRLASSLGCLMVSCVLGAVPLAIPYGVGVSWCLLCGTTSSRCWFPASKVVL